MAVLTERDWSNIGSQSARGRLLPVIGDRFFWQMAGGFDGLIRAWADDVQYPGGQIRRASLAQFVGTEARDTISAKESYLDFLKEALLRVADSSDSGRRDHLDELRARFYDLTVSEMARDIGLSALAGEGFEAYRALAALDVPIYITSGYHDFLEQALLEAGKTPQSEMCRWRDNLPYDTNPAAESTPGQPLVFHLFGLDTLPESLVLTEADHLRFLTKLALDPDIVPPVVRQAMTLSSLLLLGYQLREWEFRVVFRGLILGKSRRIRRMSVATQPDPKGQDQPNPERVTEFVERYFDSGSFSVYWGSDQAFLRELWERQRKDQRR